MANAFVVTLWLLALTIVSCLLLPLLRLSLRWDRDNYKLVACSIIRFQRVLRYYCTTVCCRGTGKRAASVRKPQFSILNLLR